EAGVREPTPRQVYDWVCAIRTAKLPDPRVIGNAGSFFKNPTVTPEQCQDIIAREPRIVHYPLPDGTVKLAAGWLIDACGWKGKSGGQAGVYEKQALVLVNRGGATGGEGGTLARAIQTSVDERFGIRLEPEPVVVGTRLSKDSDEALCTPAGAFPAACRLRQGWRRAGGRSRHGVQADRPGPQDRGRRLRRPEGGGRDLLRLAGQDRRHQGRAGPGRRPFGGI